jgi:protein-S-isoprenylcysteine O-methyltransferase Ste14
MIGMATTKRTSATAVASIVLLLVVLGLRRQEMLADSVAVALVLVLGLAFAIATTLTGLRTARAARERSADEATATDDHRSL